MSAAWPHYHMKCHRRALSFPPSAYVFQTYWREQGGGEALLPPRPPLTMRHKVLAEGTSQCALGLFLMTANGCDSLRVCPADDGFHPTPTPKMSRQPVLCASPHLIQLLPLQFTYVSPAAGLQA